MQQARRTLVHFFKAVSAALTSFMARSIAFWSAFASWARTFSSFLASRSVMTE